MGQIEKRQPLINQIRKQFGLIESSGKQFLPHRHNHRTENNTIGRREQQNNEQLCWTYLNMLLQKKKPTSGDPLFSPALRGYHV